MFHTGGSTSRVAGAMKTFCAVMNLASPSFIFNLRVDIIECSNRSMTHETEKLLMIKERRCHKEKKQTLGIERPTGACQDHGSCAFVARLKDMVIKDLSTSVVNAYEVFFVFF